MINDLISREALLKKAIKVSEFDEGGWEAVLRAVPVEEIEAAEAVDAAPVVHGRWKSANMFGVTVWECNECNAGFGRKWEYCPHCGAKMDAKE